MTAVEHGAGGVRGAGGGHRAARVRAARGAVALTWRGAPGAVALSVVVALVGAVAPVAVAWLTRSTLDALAAGGTLSALISLAAGLAAAGIVQALLPQFDQYLRAEIDRAAGTSGTERLHDAVDRFVGLGRFEDPVFLDRLRMAVMGTQSAGHAFAAGLGTVRAALTLAGLFVSLAVLSPAMAAVVLVAAVPTFCAELAVSRRRTTMMWNIGPAERREAFYQNLLTRAETAKEIRLFGAGALLRGRMLAERRRANAAKRQVDRKALAVQGGLALLSALVAGGGLIWMIRSVRTGGYSLGDVSLFIAAVAGTQGALASMISQIATANERLLIFGYLRDVMTAGPDLPVPATPRPAPRLRHGIEFRDVWFRYSEDHPWVLRGVTLFIPSGRSVALVGRNGAGKSTIVKLLCRFYDPVRGSIHWDGTDIRDLDPRTLRERVSAVFQDFVEYDLTAAENIGLGDVPAMDDRRRVVDAAIRAGAHDAVTALPSGYDTLLSRIFLSEAERGDPAAGVNLSGGQWQRVALARAMMRVDPDILILDEPSAGLDAAAEAEIHAALRRHRAGRTSLLISHRLSAVRDADTIIVLDDGLPIEHGDHDELMTRGGEYATLFRQQAAGYTDRAPLADARSS